MTPAERDASYLRFVARQAGHHAMLRALAAMHPNRALLRDALQREAAYLTREPRQLPPATQEQVTEEIVSWLALLA
jgi:hypothetical protein